MSSHTELRSSLGAYVLGALEPAELADVGSHLEECANCRAELADLAALPGLLGRLGPDEARLLDQSLDQSRENGATARPLEAALHAVAARRRTSRLRTLVAAAAAVLLLAGGAGALTLGRHEPGPVPGVTVSASDAGTHVRGSATLRTSPAGTQIALSLHGVPYDERCRLVVVGSGGQREVAGSWRAAYDGAVSVEATSAWSRQRMARLDVVTFGGRRLVSIPVT